MFLLKFITDGTTTGDDELEGDPDSPFSPGGPGGPST